MFRPHLNTAVNPPCIELTGSLTIADAAQARQDLLGLLVRLPSGPLHLDAALVEEIDGAGLQLLLATARVLTAGNRSVLWVAISEPLQRVAQAVGAADASYCCGVPFGQGVPAC